jgi:hypothetical protein
MSSLLVDSSVYVFPGTMQVSPSHNGDVPPTSIQKIDLNGDSMSKSEVIGNAKGAFYPVIMKVEPNFCT